MSLFDGIKSTVSSWMTPVRTATQEVTAQIEEKVDALADSAQEVVSEVGEKAHVLADNVAFSLSALPVVSSLPDLVGKAKSAIKDGQDAVSNLLYGDTEILNQAKSEPPQDPSSLRVMTYNIYVKGDLDKVKESIKQSGADVVALQEATPEKAQELAKALDMNVICYSKGPNAGKAILSRYPIETGEHVNYPDSLGSRISGYASEYVAGKDHLEGNDRLFCIAEPLEERGILRATLRIGERTVDILDTHLSLRVTDRNTEQFQYLDSFAQKRRDLGHEVVLLGDFNTNLNIHSQDAPGVDTLAEYEAEYHRSLGNIGDSENLEAVEQLRSHLADVWNADAREVLNTDGERISLEAAQQKLAAASPSDAGYSELQDQANANSNTGDDKRYDGIFSSLPVSKSWIDFSAKGSDHQPVIAEISLKGK